MRAAYWTCVVVGCGAAIVPVAPEIMAAYRARHPIADSCHVDCHWVIPPDAFRPGGELWAPPGGTAAVTPPHGGGGNTAPWPAVLPPAMWMPGPGAVGKEEATEGEHHRRCRRLRVNHCKDMVDMVDVPPDVPDLPPVPTPEPSSALSFLGALLMLAGVLHMRRGA